MSWIAVILSVTLAVSAVGGDGVMVQLVLKEAQVEQVVALYSDLTGKKVEVEAGVHATVSLRTEKDVTKGEAGRRIEEALREQNVGLFQKARDILVARWIDPTMTRPKKAGGLSPSTPIVFGTATNGRTRLSYKMRREELRRERMEARAARTNASAKGNTVSLAETNATECVLEDGDAKPMTEEGPNRKPKSTP